MEMSRRGFVVGMVFGSVGGLRSCFTHSQPSALSAAELRLPKANEADRQRVERMIAERKQEMREEEIPAQRRELFYRIRRGKMQLDARNYAAAIHALGWGGSC